ncbi:divergent polysaccharide deacetylase family protein [Nannocystaceae bacterium ST9]
MSRPASRLAPALLVAWVGLAGALFLLADPPPEPPAVGPDDQAIRDRMSAWAVRDAEQWTEADGDLTIPWAKAEGHMVIVIDDVGRELDLFEDLLALRFPLTFSVLPGSIYASGVQQRLLADDRRPREILLHLPMEPLDPAPMQLDVEAGEIYLLASDDPAQLRAKTLAALDRVPHAIGVNNHMGSKLTADAEAMAAIMPALRERGVFFLDSRTTPETLAASEASEAGVPTISRQVFLDHDPSRAAIRTALRQAAERSRSEPTVVIAHPSQAVVEVLREELPRLHADGVGVYPASRLLAASTPR